MAGTLILLTHLAATLYMTGLIWFVQVVHYPLFNKVGTAGFAAYEEAHTRLTGWVVGPPMLIELFAAGILAAHPPDGTPGWQVWLGLGLVGVIWLSTVALQIPQHNVLGGGFDPNAHRLLVSTNWARTIAWSLRSLLALWMVFRLLK
jgi:hypothetical protein